MTSGERLPCDAFNVFDLPGQSTQNIVADCALLYSRSALDPAAHSCRQIRLQLAPEDRGHGGVDLDQASADGFVVVHQGSISTYAHPSSSLCRAG